MAAKLYLPLPHRQGADAREIPVASVVVPVNAQGDLENVLELLDDVGGYAGPHHLEVVLVVNNYPAESPPAFLETYRRLGAKVLAIPDAWRCGENVAFTARVAGARAAASDHVILFDADCRIPDPTALLNWYIEQLHAGAKLAYTRVEFSDLPARRLARIRVRMHHGARWVKRNVMGIPTARGSNYAADRRLLTALYDQGCLAEDMNVGPVFKEAGALIVYSPDLVVMTSGRMITGTSLLRMVRYFAYRLRYNLRVLPVRSDAARFNDRVTRPTRRYIDNRPVRETG